MPRLGSATIARVSSGVVLVCAFALPAQQARSQESRPAASPARVLDRSLPEVQFTSHPFAQVLDWLGMYTQTKIVVEWTEIGVAKDAPVSVSARNITVRTLLTLLLADAGKGERECGFKARGDTIVISSAPQLAGPISVRDYDLTPLVKQFEARGFKVQPDEIAAAVQGATNRGQWGAERGAGSLVVDARKLKVSQTERGHAEIETLLTQLDKPHSTDAAEQKRDEETLKALEQRVPEVMMEPVFDQVIDWLAEYTQQNFFVDWPRIDDAGVKRDTRATISNRNPRLREVLDSILAEAGGKKLPLAYDIIGGVVWISTTDEIARGFTVRVHDVSALVDNAKPNDAALPHYIQEHALKESWRSAGGPAALWLIGDRLVVLQGCRGHHAVEEALKEYLPQRRP